MTYRLGAFQEEYIPRRCSFKAKGLCEIETMAYPNYFQLAWDWPVDDVDLYIENDYCPFTFADSTCSMPNGGQYCFSGDIVSIYYENESKKIL